MRAPPFERRWVGAAAIAGPAVIALALYAATLAPTVHWGDTADLQRAALLLDTPHPTGYPLYLSVGRLWSSALRIGDPAWRLNLLSAVLSAGTVAVTGWAALRLTGRASAAALAGLALAVTPSVWSQAVVAEVYALHTLLVCLLLAAALGRRPRPWTIALLLGLGLAHHRMIVLVVPGLAASLWLRRRDLAWTARDLAPAAACLAVGPCLYLVTWLTKDWPDVTQFLIYVLHAGDAHWSIGGMRRHLAGAVLPILTQQVHVLGLGLALVGLAWTARRGHPQPAAAAWLLGPAWLASLGFLLVYRVGDLYAFAGQLHVVQALLVAAGAVAVGQAVAASPQPVGRASKMRIASLAAVAAVALVLQAQATHRAVARSDEDWRWPAREATLALGHVESRAILVTGYLSGETARYLTEAAGVRPDVQVVIRDDVDGQWAAGLLDVGPPVYLWGGGWREAFGNRPERLVDMAAGGGPNDLYRVVRPSEMHGVPWHELDAAAPEGSADAGAAVALRPWPLVADAPAEAAICPRGRAAAPSAWLLEIDPDHTWLRTVAAVDGIEPANGAVADTASPVGGLATTARASSQGEADTSRCTRHAFVVPPGPTAGTLPLRVSALGLDAVPRLAASATVSVRAAGDHLHPDRMSHLRVDGPASEARSRVIGIENPPTARPGMSVPVTAYWWVEPGDPHPDATGHPTWRADWSMEHRSRTVDERTEVDVLADFHTAGWTTPAIVADTVALAVPRRAVPGRYRLAVTEPASRRPRAVGVVHVADWPRLRRVPGGFRAVDASWDGSAVQLRAYELATSTDALTVTLAWQAGRESDRDWKVFVHLVGPGGDVVAQHDGFPADGVRWTNGWRAGEVVVDAHRIELPVDLAPGRHTVRLGLYEESTLQRAPLDAAGHTPVAAGDALDLATVRLPETR